VLTLEHPRDAIQEFAAAPGSGAVWIATRHATYRVEDGVGHLVHRRYRAVDRPGLRRAGPDGAIWHGSGGELFRDGRPLRPAGAGAEWTGAEITSFAWDHEGSLWVRTGGAGLFQLRRHAIAVHGPPEGTSSGNVYAVYEDRAGDVWLGLFHTGLARISAAGSVTNYHYSMGRGYPPLGQDGASGPSEPAARGDVSIGAAPLFSAESGLPLRSGVAGRGSARRRVGWPGRGALS
jgi:ligand-binding sensor domain-containing protein